jgi:hypothetical protein
MEELLLSEDEMNLLAESNLQRIQEILARHDPCECIAAYRYLETQVNPEDYEENTHPGLGASVEFIASVAASLSYYQRDSTEIDLSELKELHSLSHSSLCIAQIKYLAKADKKAFDTRSISWIASQMATTSMIVRGHAYPHHLEQMLSGLATQEKQLD